MVRGYSFSKMTPTPLESPRIAALSPSALELIGLDASQILLDEKTKMEFGEFLSGNKIMPGSIPLSHNYCGH